ncbi:hypothetical protein SEUBUCD646_0K01160 [Saccharomyces eubayanus]|uniref:Aspartate aminotransferase n=1 Tax=Saccharomyces eubayanus TaxID=1080349 RepID=A0ABN8VD20_SACEU|nr:hypothetical protein SEUBUCD650_0K01180 [Saccharomyces eubayanus]CAI1561074.1 hypothetical protein SEUBUCD646_0K01160 [Saccharomyces eubayanus]
MLRTRPFNWGLLRPYFTSSLCKVPRAPPDKVLGLSEHFKKDKNIHKIDLTVGIYKDAWGKVTTFPSVAKAQKLIDSHLELNKNLSYLPITGSKEFQENVMNFLFKESCPQFGPFYLAHDRISFVQTLSGTGALAVAAKFLALFISKDIWIPDPSWANHRNIFQNNGFENIHRYSYYKDGQIDIDGWIKQLKTLAHNQKKENDKQLHCIILHACCHNPTGLDPTKEQWKEIIDTIYELKMVPIVDMAYQGLESGDMLKDAYLMRLCLDVDRYPNWSNGVFLCQSFAKNMGLYGERVGSLSVITPATADDENLNPLQRGNSLQQNIDSQLKQIVRGMYSSPPGYGSRVVNVVLSNTKLKHQWFKDVEFMAQRLHYVRKEMFERLRWPDLINFAQQHGMFYYTRFNPRQVEVLKNKFSVYLTGDGRLSLSGVNDSNIDYLCEALDAVSKMSEIA